MVRIIESTCDEGAEGSGFLVAANLVVTAAHLVTGETDLSVIDSVTGAATEGQVVGVDEGTDVALVRIQTPSTGHLFVFAGAQPQVGSRLAAIGYPLNGPESITEGSVSALGRDITLQSGQSLFGLIQTDTPINPGNSGGPIIGLDGTVAGIADAGTVNVQGINYAVPATQAAPLVGAWRQNPSIVPAATCQTTAPPPAPSSSAPSPSAPSSSAPSSSAADTAAAVLVRYFDLIDAQDFADAYALLTPEGQQRAGSEAQWAQNLAGSSYTGMQIVDSFSVPGAGFDIEATFTSTQPGQGCKNWDLDYQMLPDSNGGYLIDVALPHDGASGYTAC